MKYTVMVAATAAEELDRAYDWLVKRTPLHAPGWYNGLLEAILSLEEMPARCPMRRDLDEDDEETRQLVYGDRKDAYRILFVIRGDRVTITPIRHTARGAIEE